MAFVYLLPNEEHTLFKIGVSESMKARLITIGAKYDRALARLCEIDREYMFKTERALHESFRRYRRLAPYQSGNTEWFDMVVFDAAVDMAHALKGPLHIKRIIDLVEYLEDEHRGRLHRQLQKRESTREYFNSLSEKCPGREKQKDRIRRNLSYPYLLNEAIEYLGWYSLSTTTWYDNFFARLFAIHGRHVNRAVLRQTYLEVAVEVNAKVEGPDRLSLFISELSIEAGLEEYKRRLLYFSEEEQLAMAIRHIYQPDTSYLSTVPAWVLDRYNDDQFNMARAA